MHVQITELRVWLKPETCILKKISDYGLKETWPENKTSKGMKIQDNTEKYRT